MLDYRYTEFSGYFCEYYGDSRGIQHIKWVQTDELRPNNVSLQVGTFGVKNCDTLVFHAGITLEITLEIFFNLELGPF